MTQANLVPGQEVYPDRGAIQGVILKEVKEGSSEYNRLVSRFKEDFQEHPREIVENMGYRWEAPFYKVRLTGPDLKGVTIISEDEVTGDFNLGGEESEVYFRLLGELGKN